MAKCGSWIDAERRVNGLLDLLAKYRWLTDAYLVEFFASDHWSLLPVEWQHFFAGLSASECYQFVGLVADHSELQEFLRRFESKEAGSGSRVG